MKSRLLRDLFHLVKQVLPETQNPLTFPSDKPVIEALTVMHEHNFSQVPVVEGNEVLGVFSYRSFSEGLVKLPKKEQKPLLLHVFDFMEDLEFAQVTDIFTELIDELNLKDAVLVGSEKRLQGIVTTIDALQYFYKAASPYIMLREIELAIRALIRASVDEKELKSCIDKSLKKKYEKLGLAVPTCVEDMTWQDYVDLLRYKGTWDKFSPAFGGRSTMVNAKLEKLPKLRNDVFHFRREITVEEYEKLRYVRNWLLKRIIIIEVSRNSEQNG